MTISVPNSICTCMLNNGAIALQVRETPHRMFQCWDSMLWSMAGAKKPLIAWIWPKLWWIVARSCFCVVDGQEYDYTREDTREWDPAYKGISTNYVATHAQISAPHQATLLYNVTGCLLWSMLRYHIFWVHNQCTHPIVNSATQTSHRTINTSIQPATAKL